MSEKRTGLRLTEQGEGWIRKILTDYDGTVIVDEVVLPHDELIRFMDKKIKDYYPIFLLDEVLSELDLGKRTMLIKHLQEADFQTFLTAVNIDNMDNLNAHNGASFIVKAGQLKRKEL